MLKKTMIVLLSLVLLLNLTACNKSNIQANTVESWPTDTVKIFVAGPAGAVMDLKARLVAKYLGDELGKPVVVENRPGASGITGVTEYLSEKANTNNIMLLGNPYFQVIPFYNDVQYKVEDFTLVRGIDYAENGLFVSAKTGVKSLKELKKYGEDKTIKFPAGGAGNDTFMMVKFVLESLRVKSDLVTVSGFSEGLLNCATGVVDVVYCALNQAEQYVEEGSIIPLAVYNEEAFTGYEKYGYKEVPSFTELGIEAVYKAVSTFGIRSGTDQAIVDKLSNAIANVYANEEFIKEFNEAGFIMLEDTTAEGTQKVLDSIAENLDAYLAATK